MDIFETEARAYACRRRELARDNAGKFVVFDRERLVGIFDDPGTALVEAFRQLGRSSFFMRPISAEPIPMRANGAVFVL